MTEEKTCFVISPIGGEGSKIRVRANDILNHIIKPAAEEFDYNVIRADEIAGPGRITHDIVKHLINDPLVIADCTGKNANVFYELAVRHAAKEPAIQMMEKGQGPPFDVQDMRTVKFSRETLGEAEQCKIDLKEHIKAVEEGPKEESTNSPISSTIELSSFYESDTPEAEKFEKIITELEKLNNRVARIEQKSFFIPRLKAKETGMPLDGTEKINFDPVGEKDFPTNITNIDLDRSDELNLE